MKGTFSSPDTILVSEYHVPNDLLRDEAFYVGLNLIIILWFDIFLKQKQNNE